MLEERQAASLGASLISGITAATPLVRGHCLSPCHLEVPGAEDSRKAGCRWQGVASK